MRWLENKGLELMEEVSFPPYRVDIYLPDYHAVIEYDGPQHTAKQDYKRDVFLVDEYKLTVFHVSAKDWSDKNDLWARITDFLVMCLFSKDGRWKEVEDRLPWL